MPKMTTEVDRTVGARVKARRQALGLSQTALAQSVGVTFQQVQKYENGQNRISVGRMQTFAKVLDVELSYFFESENERPSAVSEFLCSTEGVRLAQLFVAIRSPVDRRMLLQLAERFVAIDAAFQDNDPGPTIPMAAE